MFTIPGASAFADLSLLLMRLVLALVFGTSGWGHLRRPGERAKSIGMSVPFTVFLGAAELAGAIGLATGLLAPWAALGLILVMLGAIQKKITEWNYEVLLIVMNLVIVTMGPGKYSL